MKKITAIILALVLVLSLNVAALATPTGNLGDSNQGNTTVSIVTADSAQLSVNVPLSVTIAVDAEGAVTTPNNYKIVNSSVMPVYVSAIVIAAKENFSITAAANMTDIGAITIKPGEGTEDALEDFAVTTGATYWNMTAKNDSATTDEIAITFGGSVPSFAQSVATATQAFTITYTISSGAYTPPSEP